MAKKVRAEGSVAEAESEDPEPESEAPFTASDEGSDPLEQAVKSREDSKIQDRVIDKIFFIKRSPFIVNNSFFQ